MLLVREKEVKPLKRPGTFIMRTPLFLTISYLNDYHMLKRFFQSLDAIMNGSTGFHNQDDNHNRKYFISRAISY